MKYCPVEPLEARIAPATLSIADASVAEGNAGTRNLNFTVTLSEAVAQNVTVEFGAVDQTATAGSDYTAPGAGSVLTFTPGTGLTRTISIPILGDTTDELDETFLVNLSNPAGATVADGQAQGRIQNDELILSVENVSQAEGSAGTTIFEFEVKLNGASTHDVSVDYATASGTARLDDNDYAATTGTLTIPAGATSGVVSVTVNGDLKVEQTETFLLNFTNPANAIMPDQQAVGTVVNDDPLITIGDVVLVEGNSGTTNAVFTVTLSAVGTEIVQLDFTTKDGTAKATGPFAGIFADYVARAGTLTFDPNDPVVANRTSQQIVVPVIGDVFKEANEEFTVELSNVRNGTITDASGKATLQNGTDSVIGLALNDAMVVEGNSGTRSLEFTAVLSDPTYNQNVTFNVATQSGTSLSGSDFTAKTTNGVTIAAGTGSTKFAVEVRGDTTFEAVESLFVNLTGASGNVQVADNNAFGGAQATARGYIFNDDTQQLGPGTLQWVDVDGDLVTLKVSKGALSFSSSALTLVNSGSNGGKQLQKLDLTGSGSAAFAGTSISVTAERQAGLPLEFATNARVDVGYIHAAVFDTLNFQVFGKDLGTVTIDGDLAKIDAGDAFSTPAISRLDVFSLGARGTGSGAPDTQSDIIGPITSLNVKQDVLGFVHVIGAEFGRIGTLKIGGALQGGSGNDSGQISVTGTITTATIGSIVGGSGDNSGLLLGSVNAGGNLGTIKVLGDIVGGSGDSSGKIQAARIGSVSAANVLGGVGSQSGVVIANSTLGSVSLAGDLRGGSGENSGEIFGSVGVGAVKIAGDIVGGENIDSGSLVSGGGLLSLAVGGAIFGGTGSGSGSVQVTTNLGAVTIGASDDGDSLVGSSGADSGQISAGLNLKSLVAEGSVRGGLGTNSGAILANGSIDKLVIGQDLVGANAPAADPETPNAAAITVESSGIVIADRLKSVLIGGDIVAGQTLGAGEIAGSGAIRANLIDVLTVKGDLLGQADNPVIIGAGGLTQSLAIKSVAIGGKVEFAEILAGYRSNAAAGDSQRGDLVSADASIGTVSILGSVKGLSIIAGAQAGADGRFGSADDKLNSGAGVLDTAAISRIASVIIRGDILPHSGSTGIVAQHIVSVRTGAMGVPLALQAGPGNDLSPGVELGVGTNFRALELALPTT